MKQEPFLLCLMTRQKKCDNQAILYYPLESFDAPNVSKLVSDIEKAMWLAIDSSFPKKKHHKGFNFPGN